MRGPLVSQLAVVQGDIRNIRGNTYINSAKGLKELSYLCLFGRAAMTCNATARTDQIRAALEKAQGHVLERLCETVAYMLEDVHALSERTQ
ncbi:MAG: hypothetical protein FD153_205 [Rhodospirillaceae bacterium]|nr:MAG: hypothetical protein FD153_205 [Rhodospirillaceae bacterium]